MRPARSWAPRWTGGESKRRSREESWRAKHRGVESGVGSVHLLVVVLEGSPQLVGVGLGLGGFSHAGNDRVVARCLDGSGGGDCGCGGGGAAVVGGVGLVQAFVV